VKVNLTLGPEKWINVPPNAERDWVTRWIFFEGLKRPKSILSVHVLMVFKIVDCLVGEKIKYKDSENTSYCNSKIVPKASTLFLSSFFSCSLADFLPWLATSHWMQENPPIDVHLMSGFWNNFKDHS
jgi:hypothetical protein